MDEIFKYKKTYSKERNIKDDEMKCHGEKYSSHQPEVSPRRHSKQALVLTQANTHKKQNMMMSSVHTILWVMITAVAIEIMVTPCYNEYCVNCGTCKASLWNV